VLVIHYQDKECHKEFPGNRGRGTCNDRTQLRRPATESFASIRKNEQHFSQFDEGDAPTTAKLLRRVGTKARYDSGARGGLPGTIRPQSSFLLAPDLDSGALHPV
jgi:hypothetical protein